MAKKDWRNTTRISRFDFNCGKRLLISLILLTVGLVCAAIAGVVVLIAGNNIDVWDLDKVETYLDAYEVLIVIAIVLIVLGVICDLIPKSAREIFAQTMHEVIELECTNHCGKISQGTAIMIQKGILVTNAHNIFDEDQEKIYEDIHCFFLAKNDFSTLASRKAEIIKYDKNLDIAILRIIPLGKETFTEIKKGKVSSLKTGDKVYAMGNSLGNGVAISPGMISVPLVKDRWGDDDDEEYFIQSTVAAIEGNSGGAILDRRGRLVGMCTFQRTENPNFEYAIPVERIMEYLKE